jgi:arsenate reductase-like glutaredoxin family protein|tara:strand:- start:1073 stop:1345 length:273 start_codon:yes stop_codon:yes gene_type:complete
LEASKIEVKDRTPASRKLQESDSRDLLSKASKLIAMKGKKVTEFNVAKEIPDGAVAAMLGPTGNLRSPTIKTGRKLIVGFNQEIFEREFG